jgi:hypothetical protein
MRPGGEYFLESAEEAQRRYEALRYYFVVPQLVAGCQSADDRRSPPMPGWMHDAIGVPDALKTQVRTRSGPCRGGR